MADRPLTAPANPLVAPTSPRPRMELRLPSRRSMTRNNLAQPSPNGKSRKQCDAKKNTQQVSATCFDKSLLFHFDNKSVFQFFFVITLWSAILFIYIIHFVSAIHVEIDRYCKRCDCRWFTTAVYTMEGSYYNNHEWLFVFREVVVKWAFLNIYY